MPSKVSKKTKKRTRYKATATVKPVPIEKILGQVQKANLDAKADTVDQAEILDLRIQKTETAVEMASEVFKAKSAQLRQAYGVFMEAKRNATEARVVRETFRTIAGL